MAWNPCDSCGSRFIGKAAYTYAALVEQSERVQNKLRLCPACYSIWEGTVERIGERIIDGELATNGVRQLSCSSCSAVLTRRIALFATRFDQAGERVDYYAELCVPCSSILGLQVDWSR